MGTGNNNTMAISFRTRSSSACHSSFRISSTLRGINDSSSGVGSAPFLLLNGEPDSFLLLGTSLGFTQDADCVTGNVEDVGLINTATIVEDILKNARLNMGKVYTAKKGQLTWGSQRSSSRPYPGRRHDGWKRHNGGELE